MTSFRNCSAHNPAKLKNIRVQFKDIMRISWKCAVTTGVNFGVCTGSLPLSVCALSLGTRTTLLVQEEMSRKNIKGVQPMIFDLTHDFLALYHTLEDYV